MANIISKPISWVFLFIIPFLQANRPFSATQYCNRRFEYCLDYPSSLLPERLISVQSDTLLLKSIGQVAEVKVVGKLGAISGTPVEIFEKNLQRITSKNGKANTISTLFGEDFYEANFLCGDYSYHQKAGFSATRSVLLTIKVPVNRPELIVRLKEDVTIAYE